MSDFVINAYRYAEDQTQVASCLMGNNPYQVNLVTITNASINYNAPTTGRTRTSIRLTVGALWGGYLSYAPGDGYLNPPIINTEDNNVVLAQQSITDMKWLLGPIVFPYTVNTVSGGTDANLFYPALASNTNTQIYIQLLGPGLNPNHGVYCKIKEVILDNGNDIWYKLLIQNAGVVVP
jgi:hypothetical protein